MGMGGGARYARMRYNLHAIVSSSRLGGNPYVHPSFWLFFGYYRQITVPETDPEVSREGPWLGPDIRRDLIPLEQVPQWKRNDVGSAFLRNVCHIKMKPPDFGRWFDGCFQTCLWLGTATPSLSSQMKGYNRKGKGQPKGKGKCNWR